MPYRQTAEYGSRPSLRSAGTTFVTALTRNRAGNSEVGRLMAFLTALGQDVRITAKPTKKAVRERWTWWWGEAAEDTFARRNAPC